MIHIDYSKPSADLAIEAKDWSEREQILFAQQVSLARHLKKQGSLRSLCLLCLASLHGSQTYGHRGVEYHLCGRCGHLQTKFELPDGYPYSFGGSSFEKIYPQLEESAYLSRRDRIYSPKLEWIISRLGMSGYKLGNLLSASWIEMGCGAGYFLNALLSRGATNIIGLDCNASLVVEANRHCGASVARVTKSMLDDLESSNSQIITSFFVLEHIEDVARFWQILANKPSGTIFVFSVPTFGFSTILEGSIEEFAARNLDNVVHTQLYTDQSINYALESANFQKIAEWLFGQDAHDLCRVLIRKISRSMSTKMANSITEQLTELVDNLQQVIDRSRFSDARHVIAIKR
jgi:2-polyprenyl-3-methyl-5-hydroxy-6-metoxy-1,4-benzoquinol methylase